MFYFMFGGSLLILLLFYVNRHHHKVKEIDSRLDKIEEEIEELKEKWEIE